MVIGEDGPDQVKVTVLSIKGNQVRLGVDAEKHIPVHREEIYHRLQATGNTYHEKGK